MNNATDYKWSFLPQDALEAIHQVMIQPSHPHSQNLSSLLASRSHRCSEPLSELSRECDNRKLPLGIHDSQIWGMWIDPHPLSHSFSFLPSSWGLNGLQQLGSNSQSSASAPQVDETTSMGSSLLAAGHCSQIKHQITIALHVTLWCELPVLTWICANYYYQ